MKLNRLFCVYGLMILAFVLAKPIWAIEPIHFEVRNNADLVALCSVQPDDPHYVAAIHFCHGFGVGFNRYHEALMESKDFVPLYCFPEKLSRNEALSEYVRYSKAHPEYDKETVGDVVTKFLVETYPCKSKNK